MMSFLHKRSEDHHQCEVEKLGKKDGLSDIFISTASMVKSGEIFHTSLYIQRRMACGISTSQS